MELLKKLAATALGLGYLPLAPGTWASVAAATAYVALRMLAPVQVAVTSLACGVLVGLLLGFLVCPWAQRHFGTQDPRQFVLDEVVGQWLMFLVSWWMWDDVMLSAGIGLVVFRFFDIVKPPPINRAERVAGAWGVMIDDVLAAMYGATLVAIVVRFVL